MTETSTQEVPLDTGPEIVYAPLVHVLAHTEITDETFRLFYHKLTNSFTDEATEGEHLVEYAGRSCYQSFHNPAGRTTTEYIGNIIKQRHFSVIEHVNVTFDIQGVSRALTHELIRHRHLSYSQLSQRYVDLRDIRFVCPPLFRDTATFYPWHQGVLQAFQQLQLLSEVAEQVHSDSPRKVIREAVRALAPNCIETKIVVTGNLRAWREFLEKRWNSHAEAEIQALAGMIFDQLNKLYPAIMADVVYQED